MLPHACLLYTSLTYLAAAGLLGAGLSRLRKKYPILSGTLTSTGILVL